MNGTDKKNRVESRLEPVTLDTTRARFRSFNWQIYELTQRHFAKVILGHFLTEKPENYHNSKPVLPLPQVIFYSSRNGRFEITVTENVFRKFFQVLLHHALQELIYGLYRSETSSRQKLRESDTNFLKLRVTSLSTATRGHLTAVPSVNVTNNTHWIWQWKLVLVTSSVYVHDKLLTRQRSTGIYTTHLTRHISCVLANSFMFLSDIKILIIKFE